MDRKTGYRMLSPFSELKTERCRMMKVGLVSWDYRLNDSSFEERRRQ
jgi:hypothetical protein